MIKYEDKVKESFEFKNEIVLSYQPDGNVLIVVPDDCIDKHTRVKNLSKIIESVFDVKYKAKEVELDE